MPIISVRDNKNIVDERETQKTTKKQRQKRASRNRTNAIVKGWLCYCAFKFSPVNM